jgi:predicted enzyme related to lactoylglutathione lyase
MLYINVESLDRTVADIYSSGGSVLRPRTAVSKTAWVAIVADPQGNFFGVWETDPTALPAPEPD